MHVHIALPNVFRLYFYWLYMVEYAVFIKYLGFV